MLNNRLVAELIRQRLNLPDDSQAARFINLIPQALKATARKGVADPYLRQLFTTDKSVAVITPTLGKIDLEAGYDNYYFLMEYFDLGLVYLTPTATITGVDIIDNTLSITANISQFSENEAVQLLSTSAVPAPLVAGTTYYIFSYSLGTFFLSLAPGGPGINITNAGSGTISLIGTQATNTTVPMQMLKSPQQAPLTQYLDSVFSYFYVQNNTLFLLPNTTLGNVAFAVPFYPTNLAALPESEEVERLFLDKLYELVTGPGSDAAQDAER